MKLNLTLCTLAAAAVLMMAGSCQTKTRLEPVPEPTWFDYEDYYIEKSDLFAQLPIYPENIVMLGDEIIDFGEWTDFFQDTSFVNRGIMFEGSPHTLYRVDGIAQAKPKKIFVSTGLQDIKRAKDEDASAAADEVIANVKEIFRRAHALSPETRLFFLSIVADRQVSDAGVAAIEKANKAISEDAAKSKYYEIIDISGLADESGRMAEQYTYDGRSLNGAGYEIVTDQLLHKGFSSFKEKYNKAADREYKEISPAHHNRVSLFNSLPENTHSVIFLGNSITRRGPWEELLPIVRTSNRGVGGDTVKGIYNRLDDVAAAAPAAIFLMAGINDLTNPACDVDQLWKEYSKLIEAIKKEIPNTPFYVQSTLPVTAERDSDNTINPKVHELNKYLQAAEKKFSYIYLDVAKALSDENGCLKAEYSIDGLHLNADAYFVWSTVLINEGSLVMLARHQRTMDEESNK